MTSLDPACNYGMFQSCTISYQTPPACFAAFNIAGKIFMSNEQFNDIFGNFVFYYYFYCQNSQFFLTRIYCTSPYGSPYRDLALYSWLIGGYGNTCPQNVLILNPDYVAWDDCIAAYDNAHGTIGATPGGIRECGNSPPEYILGPNGLPFSLLNGVAFSGSDASCKVTITEA